MLRLALGANRFPNQTIEFENARRALVADALGAVNLICPRETTEITTDAIYVRALELSQALTRLAEALATASVQKEAADIPNDDELG